MKAKFLHEKLDRNYLTPKTKQQQQEQFCLPRDRISIAMPDDEMLEDCPHRQQLEHTLLHCQTQSEILQATRHNYLSIIDEFKRDLEELTEQQPTFAEESCELVPAHINSELELQNERLACQIHNLQDNLKDRDQQIQQLHGMINGYSDFSENTRLKEEIHELKQKNSDQSRKVREIAALLKTQEDQRIELCNKYETLMNSFEDQCKELKRANRRVQGLQERLAQMEKLQDELQTERQLLREEVMALKDKDAKASGRERALCDQLKFSHLELEKSRRLIRDLQCHLKQEECQHQETVQQLEQANEDIRQQMRAITSECKQMQHKLKQQKDVNQQQLQIIESFRKWKDAQIRSDEAMHQCIKTAEEHIHLQIEEKQRLCEEYKRLHRDYCLLETEMQRVRQAVNSGRGESEAPANPEAGNEMAKRLQCLGNASRRMADQYKTLTDDSLMPSPYPEDTIFGQ